MNSNLSFFRLFFGVLIHPRKTIQTILDNDPGYYVWRLILAYGILGSFNPVFFMFLNKYLAWPFAFLAQLFLVMGSNIFTFLISSWILYLFGKWMGGKGNYRAVKAAYVWGIYPPSFILLIFLQLKEIPNWVKVLGGETSVKDLMMQPITVWVIATIVIALVFAIWALALSSITIAVTHKFSVWKPIGIYLVFIAVVITLTLGVAFYFLHHEVVNRAQMSYEKGEVLFAQKNYKEAMWDYQEVQEFYNKPHTQWLDLAEEKEWICRAYLNDWVPPKGPMNTDIRKLHPDLYEKYKAKLAQITPVPQTSNK